MGEAETPAAACQWCGAALGRGAASAPGGRLCGRCGATTTYPTPSDAELELAYEGWYRPRRGRFGALGDALLSRSRTSLAAVIDDRAPRGPVLDVGAGDGTLVRALRTRGREAIGIERRADGEGIIDADPRDIDREFSAIVFWHSLEHLRDAGSALAHTAGLLRPGGILVIAMPNSASLQARAFGDSWLALDLPRHLVHVPAPALRRRLADLGLEVERVSYVRGGQVLFGWAYGLVNALPGSPDLYDAIRIPEARRRPISAGRRAGTLAAAVALAPVAALAAAAEVAMRRGGTVYAQARRA